MKKLYLSIYLSVCLSSCGYSGKDLGIDSPSVNSEAPEYTNDELYATYDILNMPLAEFVAVSNSISGDMKKAKNDKEKQKDIVFNAFKRKSKAINQLSIKSILGNAATVLDVGPLDAYIGSKAASAAVIAAAYSFPNHKIEDMNERNAFQHAYWNGLMAKSMSKSHAFLISEYHEQYSDSYMRPVSWMDLFNNAGGLSIVDDFSYTPSDYQIGNQVLYKMKLGNFYIMNPNTYQIVNPNHTSYPIITYSDALNSPYLTKSNTYLYDSNPPTNFGWIGVKLHVPIASDFLTDAINDYCLISLPQLTCEV